MYTCSVFYPLSVLSEVHQESTFLADRAGCREKSREDRYGQSAPCGSRRDLFVAAARPALAWELFAPGLCALQLRATQAASWMERESECTSLVALDGACVLPVQVPFRR